MISGMMVAVIVGIAAVAVGVGAYFALYPIGYNKGSTTTSNYGSSGNSSTSGHPYASNNPSTSSSQNPSSATKSNSGPSGGSGY